MNFRLVILLVAFFALLSLSGSIALSIIFGDPSPPNIQALTAGLFHTFELCVGAIVGLLGGRFIPNEEE